MVLKLTSELLGMYQPATLSPAQKICNRLVAEAQQQAARESMAKKQSVFKPNAHKNNEPKTNTLSSVAQKYDQEVAEHLQQLRKYIKNTSGFSPNSIAESIIKDREIAAILPQTDPNSTTVSKADDYYYFFGDDLPAKSMAQVKPNETTYCGINSSLANTVVPKNVEKLALDKQQVNLLLDYMEKHIKPLLAIYTFEQVIGLNPGLTKQLPAEPISQLTAPPPIDEAERIWQITKDIACND